VSVSFKRVVTGQEGKTAVGGSQILGANRRRRRVCFLPASTSPCSTFEAWMVDARHDVMFSCAVPTTSIIANPPHEKSVRVLHIWTAYSFRRSAVIMCSVSSGLHTSFSREQARCEEVQMVFLCFTVTTAHAGNSVLQGDPVMSS
jgi:hypothetical protein